MAKYHKRGGLKQKSVSSQFWRLEVRNQGVFRARLPPKALGKAPALPLPAFDGRGHSSAYGSITSVSASDFMWPSSLCLSVSSLLRVPVIGSRAQLTYNVVLSKDP